jgi:hypothetical protein
MAIDIGRVTKDLEVLATVLGQHDCNDRLFFDERYLEVLDVLKHTATKDTYLPFVQWYDEYFLRQMRVSWRDVYAQRKFLPMSAADGGGA